MRLSIIIPAYNEESTIAELVKQVKKAKLPRGIKKEIIIIDDASKDETYNIIKKIDGVKVFRNKQNKGKGATVKKGFNQSSGEIVIIQDADLEYDPGDYKKLIRPILDGKSKVVFGTRLKNYPLKLYGKKKTPLITHFLGNKLLSLATRILYKTNLSDMETCYKVFKREVIQNMKIKSSRFEFEPEITAKILKRGYKIYEVPIKVNPRGYEEGKKITWRDGFIALATLVKYKFVD